MLKGNDKELYDYTMKMMENITSHYLTTDFDKGTDVNKLIEHGVARKIAAIMPDKYTEVEVTVAEVGKNLYVTATYSIDGDAEIVAIHKEELSDAYTYDPLSIDEDFFFGHPAAPFNTGTARSKLDALLNEKVSLGVSCRGTDSKALKTKDYPQYDENGNYDPRCMTEVFECTFGATEGRGSHVETLPRGEGLGIVDEDMSYFRNKLMKGLKRTINPPYTKERIETTKKAEEAEDKPTIDFSSLSLLNEPTGTELPRYETGMHVSIDLAKVNVKEDAITTQMAKEISAEIDKQIMNDIMEAAAKIDKSTRDWMVPTFGWTEETTNWNTKSELTYTVDRNISDGFFNGTSTLNNSFGVITYNTTNTLLPVWYNPNGSLMEEISFTEADLDELAELINTSESKVMEFA